MLKPRQTKQLPASCQAFRGRLLAWFDAEGRDYPWRRTHDPYEVLVSEVMLQQTQISTVLGKGYYQRFLEAFPDAFKLAEADDASLLKAWEGLGYYRRARMLRGTARAVVKEYAGVFPSELPALLDLPGIGPYTAGALRAFAFGQPAVVVDGNVLRVLSRLMNYRELVDSGVGQTQIRRWAELLADEKNPRSYHAALMELGQRICRPGLPDCGVCPVAAFCATRQPEDLPRKKARVKASQVEEFAIWVRNQKGQVLMHHEQGSRRTGLWKLPLRDAADLQGKPIVAQLDYVITRYKVRLRVHELSDQEPAAKPAAGDVWVDEQQIDDLAMAAPFRRAVERILTE